MRYAVIEEVADQESGEHGENCFAHLSSATEAKNRIEDSKVIDKDYPDTIFTYRIESFNEGDPCPVCEREDLF